MSDYETPDDHRDDEIVYLTIEEVLADFFKYSEKVDKAMRELHENYHKFRFALSFLLVHKWERNEKLDRMYSDLMEDDPA